MLTILNPTVKLWDDQFDIDKTDKYRLYVQVGIYDLQICVADNRHRQFLILEDYEFQANDDAKMADHLPALMNTHPLFQKQKWKSITLSVKNDNFLLIPNSLYSQNKPRAYFALTFPDQSDLHYFYDDQLKQDQACSLFYCEKELIDHFSNWFAGHVFSIVHHVSAFIAGTVQPGSLSKGNTVFLFLDKNRLCIIVRQHKKLLLCNVFYVTSEEEVLRYVLIVMQELGLDQYSSRIRIWSNTEKEISHYVDMLSKYITHVLPGGRPHLLKPGLVTETLKNHEYFDLFNLYLIN